MTILNTYAIDNHGYQYAVTLTPKEFYGENAVLRIENTSGSWFLSTLWEYKNSQIAIDHGQGWMCLNIQDILQEARSLIDASAAVAAEKADEETLWSKLCI
jgi:hypothetical protein